MSKTPAIGPFRGVHGFLSNFHATPLTVFGRTWPTAEHAYQAMKSPDADVQDVVLKAATPGLAKRLGRRLTLRSDWEDAKIDVMTEVVRAKFQDPQLRRRLLATGDAELIELNTWGDTFYGVCNGKGRNELGKILMRVRGEIRARHP